MSGYNEKWMIMNIEKIYCQSMCDRFIRVLGCVSKKSFFLKYTLLERLKL